MVVLHNSDIKFGSITKDHVQICKNLPEAQIHDIYHFHLDQHDFLFCHRRKLNWSDTISILKGLAIFICTIQGDYQFHYMCDFCCFVFLFLKRIFQYTELR